MKANLQECASALGVSVPTIRRWAADGMPYDSKGSQSKPWVFDIPRCVQWIKDQAVLNAVGDVSDADFEQLKKRKLAAETTVAEVQAARERGEVIRIEDAIRVRTAEALAVKAKLLSIPSRIDHVLAGSSDRRFCRQVLTDEIYGALEELATRSIDVSLVFPDGAGEEGDGLGSASEPEAERVGGTKRKDPGRKRAAR